MLVTGAARGLARGIALALAADGHRVAINYRSESADAQRTLRDLQQIDVAALGIRGDLSDASEAQRVVSEAEAHYGRLDVLVAGVGPIIVKPFRRSTLEEYHAMLAGNLTSAVACAFAALPGMRERRYGRLIFFGMNGSHTTQPARGMSLYAAAKAGVVSFSRTLALEEAQYGITSNVIEPGDIRDKEAPRDLAHARAANNPAGHAGSWEDVADVVRFFISPEAAFINGQVIGVNGGLVGPHE